MNNYAFIDSQNLHLGTQNDGWQIDYGKLRLYLKNKYSVNKAFMFLGYIRSNRKMYNYFRKCGYILIFKPVINLYKQDARTYKGNIDAELVMHCILEKPNYDNAIIVSGDGDFYCLVEHLESQKKLLKILTPSRRYSSLLKKYAKFLIKAYDIKRAIQKK